MSKERVDSTADARAKLQQIQEFAPYPMDARVARFASFLAERIGDHGLVPEGFMMLTTLALYDLEQGVDGFTGKPLDTGLEHCSEDVHNLLFLNSPNLADIIFPKPFADAYREQFGEMIKESGIIEDEVVLRPVTNLADAEELIIGSAKNRVLKLDWQHFVEGDKSDEIGNLYEVVFPLILRNSDMNFPLNILQSNVPEEAAMLSKIPDKNKKCMAGEFWLVLAGELCTEHATAVRDWLYIKAPELVARNFNLSEVDAIMHFANDKSFLRAGKRLLSTFGPEFFTN